MDGALAQHALHRPGPRTAQEYLGFVESVHDLERCAQADSESRGTGCVLISKYPILRSSHHLLPSPHGELAPAIHATLDVYGVEVDVVVAHNGQEEDPLDRELQSKELGRIMGSRWPTPTIFLGEP